MALAEWDVDVVDDESGGGVTVCDVVNLVAVEVGDTVVGDGTFDVDGCARGCYARQVDGGYADFVVGGNADGDVVNKDVVTVVAAVLESDVDGISDIVV